MRGGYPPTSYEGWRDDRGIPRYLYVPQDADFERVLFGKVVQNEGHVGRQGLARAAEKLPHLVLAAKRLREVGVLILDAIVHERHDRLDVTRVVCRVDAADDLAAAGLLSDACRGTRVPPPRRACA